MARLVMCGLRVMGTMSSGQAEHTTPRLQSQTFYKHFINIDIENCSV